MKPLRLALSGSAGTGKTSLGQRLAKELELPFIEEGIRPRLEAGLDLHSLDTDGWQKLIVELWEEQEAAEEAATSGFVSDRSSLDYAAFWLHYDLAGNEPATDEFILRMSRRAQKYTRIFLAPWGVLELKADGVRSTNPWIQLRYQGILELILERFGPAESLRPIPPTHEFEERLRFALGELPQRAKR